MKEFLEDSIPPNSQALWCRINNIIESEIEETRQPDEAVVEEPQKRGFFSGSLNLSRLQVFSLQ